MIRARAINLLLSVTLFGLARAAQTPVTQNGVVAKMDATITPAGVLQVGVTVDADGEPSMPYRGALMRDKGVGSALLFGTFLRGKHLQAQPEISGAADATHPVEIWIRIRQEDFLLPIQRQQSLALDLIPMAFPLTSAPNGTIRPGEASRYREEISVSIPEAFTVHGLGNLKEEKAFGRYESEAKLEGRRLTVTRELLLNPAGAAAATEAELNSFWKAVRADQQRVFTLNRVARSDMTQWVQSVPPVRANEYGLIAYDQREYVAARQLFERAVRFQPQHTAAWNNLGRALAALGEFEEARKAYLTQIGINAKDQYAYNNLALTYEKQGKWEEAVASLRKQLEVHPGDSHATANLPRALIYAGHWGEVEAAAAKAHELDPNNTNQKVYLAVSRICAGKTPDARHEIASMVGPHLSASTMNDTAFYLTECGKESALAESFIRDALDQIKSAKAPDGGRTISSAISHQVSLSNYLDTYGWLMLKQSKNELAANILGAATLLAPRAETYMHLAMAESTLGREQEAIRDWRQATFLEPGRVAQAPPEISQKLEGVAPLSLDRVWYPIGTFSNDAVADLPPGGASYFFVTTTGEGAVETVRPLDGADEAAKKILPALWTLRFPVVEADGFRTPTVAVVKVFQGRDGSAVAARSVTAEAVAIASDLMPGEFPLATTNTATTVSAAPGTITRPRLLERVEPAYTDEARRARLAGVVVLQIQIGEDGVPGDLKVLRALGLGLDEQAIQAVSRWRFAPAEKDGKPVAALSTIEVNFQLGGNSPWRLGRIEFRTPPSAMRPVLQGGAGPRVSSGAENATATVTFGIDEHGSVVSPRVDNATNAEWGAEVAAAIAKWKFMPAQGESGPVGATCTMDLIRGN